MNLIQESRTLSLMIEKHLGVRVAAERLEETKTTGDLLSVVLPLLPAPGRTYLERRTVEDRVARIQMASYRRTRRDVIFNFVCLRCHNRLGAEAVRLANGRWLAFLMNAEGASAPLVGRLIRDLHAVCPSCGCDYTYNGAECLLRVRERNGDAEPGAPPNGGPATPVGNSGVSQGPPSGT
jgi:hypothetical protein